MSLNGVVALILRYFTEFVVIKQLYYEAYLGFKIYFL